MTTTSNRTTSLDRKPHRAAREARLLELGLPSRPRRRRGPQQAAPGLHLCRDLLRSLAETLTLPLQISGDSHRTLSLLSDPVHSCPNKSGIVKREEIWMHWPVSMKKGSVGSDPENFTTPNIPSTWKAVEALCDAGKARAIGVSNCSAKTLGDLLEGSRIPPAVNQVELHPQWQQVEMHDFCKSKGIHLTGYAPLGRTKILEHFVVKMVVEKLGKTPAQVVLRWGLQMGHSLVPKSSNRKRLQENFDIFDWSIPSDLFAEFSGIEQERLLKGNAFVHKIHGFYKTIEELWDGE